MKSKITIFILTLMLLLTGCVPAKTITDIEVAQREVITLENNMKNGKLIELPENADYKMAAYSQLLQEALLEVKPILEKIKFEFIDGQQITEEKILLNYKITLPEKHTLHYAIIKGIVPKEILTSEKVVEIEINKKDDKWSINPKSLEQFNLVK